MAPSLTRIVSPTGEIDHVAVFASRGVCMHAGIVYRAESSLRLLHHAFHLDLRDDELRPGTRSFVCVVPNLMRDDRVALAGYCRRIFLVNSRNGGIPYNLELEAGTDFDPDTGELILPASATGMTCATFVLHVFRSAGNPLIDPIGWPKAADRPGDLEMQQSFVRILEENPSPAYQAQAGRIRHQIGCPRIRPEDVAGACLEDSLPSQFCHCDPNGRLIVAVVQTRAGQFW